MDSFGTEKMPKMKWEDFRSAHHRPHLVVVSIDASMEDINGQPRESLLEELVTALGVSGNYSIKGNVTSIEVAFESDLDAARFRSVLSVKAKTREVDWASLAMARIDHKTKRRIMVALRKSRNAKNR
jgi:hypothetical protein